MQIGYPHKSIYRLHALAFPEKSKSVLIREAEGFVKKWKTQDKQKVLGKIKQKIVGISRDTYYRRKKLLQTGTIKSKRPKNVRNYMW